jgi:hypothetical protein
MVTAIRSGSNGFIDQANVEVGDALAKEAGEARQERKKAEAPV